MSNQVHQKSLLTSRLLTVKRTFVSVDDLSEDDRCFQRSVSHPLDRDHFDTKWSREDSSGTDTVVESEAPYANNSLEGWDSSSAGQWSRRDSPFANEPDALSLANVSHSFDAWGTTDVGQWSGQASSSGNESIALRQMNIPHTFDAWDTTDIWPWSRQSSSANETKALRLSKVSHSCASFDDLESDLGQWSRQASPASETKALRQSKVQHTFNGWDTPDIGQWSREASPGIETCAQGLSEAQRAYGRADGADATYARQWGSQEPFGDEAGVKSPSNVPRSCASFEGWEIPADVSPWGGQALAESPINVPRAPSSFNNWDVPSAGLPSFQASYGNEATAESLRRVSDDATLPRMLATAMCGSDMKGDDHDFPSEWHGKTSVMVRNLSYKCTEKRFRAELLNAGLEGLYDHVHVPINFATHTCKGYAFVNFVDTRSAYTFYRMFDSTMPRIPGSKKLLQVQPSNLQGFEQNVSHNERKKKNHGRPSSASDVLLSPSSSRATEVEQTLHSNRKNLKKAPLAQALAQANQMQPSLGVPPNMNESLDFARPWEAGSSAQPEGNDPPPSFCFKCGKVRRPFYSFCQWCGVNFAFNT
eukprot:TRINITY_DN25810_c0_g1_i3.p1 TRINITY_DN25810_c0_g1~~TRINITY_DN25810_c0_g1_i3.p1  ORF type:complete len:590 (-),score=54.41 TRINITY_DN25810_c0_g1_i3:369-2138(-)